MGCVPGDPTRHEGVTTPLTVWWHGGTDAEQAAVRRLVLDWQEARGTDVELTVFEEGAYNDHVQAAAAAGALPDVLDLDGPWTANLAYRGDLVPLDDLLPSATIDDLLPSLLAQGTWDGRLYSVGSFDSGLTLLADGAALRTAGVRVPTSTEEAWTGEEMDAALAALAHHDADGNVLDLKLAYGAGEWYTYGFAPLLASAGAAVIDPRTGRAGGALDSPEATSALQKLGDWAAYADPDPAGTAFAEREVALSWVGHWAYQDAAAALGDDLVLVPLPDLGHGSRSSLGSWAWSVPADGERADDAAALVDHLLSPSSVRTLVAANSAVPGRVSVLADLPDYEPGGPLHLYADQLTRACVADLEDCVATPRPRTPGYPVVTAAFAHAVDDVLTGRTSAEVALHRAATSIDTDLTASGLDR